MIVGLGLALGGADEGGARRSREPACDPACGGALPDCCRGRCTDSAIDARNCGGCGIDCLAQGKICEQRSCIPVCAAPFVRDGDHCVLRCDPPCAADETCMASGAVARCCGTGPAEGRAFQCGDSCCDAGMQCCDGSCCAAEQQCCYGACCAPQDVCLDDPGADGRRCCAPEDFCDGVCCMGSWGCAADGRCRPSCFPSCGEGQVCCDPGAGEGPDAPPPPRFPGQTGRCVAIAELCNDECCPEGQRCATDSADPSQRLCCPAYAWCNGTCCSEGEICDEGRCRVPPTCDPPCGPDRSCCAGLVCCECCANDGGCGRFQQVTSPGGVPVRTCVPESAPSGTPPWLDPTGCSDLRSSTLYYQGIGGSCEGTLVACAESTPVHCPYHGNAIAFSEPGPLVCCDRLSSARSSRQPCDPGVDLDCDGTPNGSDDTPLGTGPRGDGGSRFLEP